MSLFCWIPCICFLIQLKSGIASINKTGTIQGGIEDNSHVNLLPSGSFKVTIAPVQSNTSHLCLPNEHGPSCKYCIPRDSCIEGHYTCDTETGNKVCRPGWRGDDCREPNSPETRGYHVTCSKGQCRNGGSCVSNRCCCGEGFTGIMCESEIIECTNDTCANGGTCRDTLGSFICVCPPGFSGRRCDKRADLVARWTLPSRDSNCQRNTCQNNGICFEDAIYVYCHCPTGFSGDRCETNLVGTNYSTSSCPPNHFGEHCDVICIPKDNCRDGHFVCHPSTGSKLCLGGWIGKNCNTRLLPQNLDPWCPRYGGCKNDGQCFQNSCCCKHNYTGDTCNVESIGCLSNPCSNNATCRTSGNGFVCACRDGYTGRQCESSIVNSTTIALIDNSRTLDLHMSTLSVTASSNNHYISPSITSTLASTTGLHLHLNSNFHLSATSAYSTELSNSVSTTLFPSSFISIASQKSFLDSGQSVTPSYIINVTSTTYFHTSSSLTDIDVASSRHFKSTISPSESRSASYISARTKPLVASTHSPPSTLKFPTMPAIPSPSLASSPGISISSSIHSSAVSFSTPMLIIPSKTVTSATVDVSATPTSASSASLVSALSPSSVNRLPSVSASIKTSGDDGPTRRAEDSRGSSLDWWLILIIVACVVVVLGIFIVVIATRIHQRRSDSRNIQNQPGMVFAFDKEHFSAQPDFTNRMYDVQDGDSDDDVKHDIYVVNE